MPTWRNRCNCSEPRSTMPLRSCPREIEKPTVTQVSVDDRPILSITLSGQVNSAILSRTAKELEDRLEKVPGVNEVKIGGLRHEVVRIQLMPERLMALGISSTQVRNAVQMANRDMPWGEIESDELGATTRLYGRFRDIETLRDLPVSRLSGAGGRAVLLKEVADVSRDLERETSQAYLSWQGGEYQQAIEISLTKVPGADSLETIENAKLAVEESFNRADWPHGLEYRFTNDQGERIWEALLRTFSSGWQAAVGVFLVLLLMLTWREALIAGLSIPLSFLGGMALVWFLGYTLNEMVLIGMVLALGLLVDVFILKMEGMHEGIYVKGLTFDQAALRTIKRFALPAFAGQMTTIMALAPLIAVSGTSGKFIRILPITAICCLIVSFIVAVLIDVPLSRYLLPNKAPGAENKTFVDRITLWLSDWLADWTYRTNLASKPIAAGWIILALSLFVIAGLAFSTLPTMLYSERDGRNMGVTVELPAGATLKTSEQCAELVGEILRKKSYLESNVKLVGKKSPMSGRLLDRSIVAKRRRLSRWLLLHVHTA